MRFCQTGELLKRRQVANHIEVRTEVAIFQFSEVRQQVKRVLTESPEEYFCQLRVRDHQGFEKDFLGRACIRLESFENVTVFLEPIQPILDDGAVFVTRYAKVAGQLGILIKDLAKAAADPAQGVKPCVGERRRLSKAWLQVCEHLSPDFVWQDSKTSLITCAVAVLQRLSATLGQANKFCVLQAPKPFEAGMAAFVFVGCGCFESLSQRLLATRCVNARSAI